METKRGNLPTPSPFLQPAERLKKITPGLAFFTENSALLAERPVLGRLGVEGAPGLFVDRLLPSSLPMGLDALTTSALTSLLVTNLAGSLLGVERLGFVW